MIMRRAKSETAGKHVPPLQQANHRVSGSMRSISSSIRNMTVGGSGGGGSKKHPPFQRILIVILAVFCIMTFTHFIHLSSHLHDQHVSNNGSLGLVESSPTDEEAIPARAHLSAQIEPLQNELKELKANINELVQILKTSQPPPKTVSR